MANEAPLLLSDEALGEPGSRQTDGLGFGAYARVLASGILESSGPLTVGIFGEWGSGKTSLMRLIAQEAGQQTNVVPVWFNAWQYEHDQHPVIPLVGAVLRELAKAEGRGGRVDAAVRSLMRALRAVAYGFSVTSGLTAGMAEVQVTLSGKEIADRARELREDALISKSLFHEAFEALDSIDFADDLRVVVFIDDLDRCFPDQAVKLLESIKLVLSRRGFVFVLGVAREVIEGYLQHRYVQEYGITGYKGHLYLDKMVQVTFTIPPSVGRMTEFSETILARQPAELSGLLSSVLPIVGRALGGNPRSVIRFLNNLLVDLAISSELASASDTDPIPIQFFAISRCLQERWPVVFMELMSSDDLASSVARWDRAEIRVASTGEDGQGRVAASLVSDRELKDLMTSREGREWLSNPTLRHASVDFLRSQSRLPSIDASNAAYDVALCYARSDRSEVSQVAETLADYGVRVLMPHLRDITDEEISRGPTLARQSRVLLVCVGSSLGLTEYQRAEVNAVIAPQAGSPVGAPRLMAVLLPGSSPDSLPQELRGSTAMDLRSGVRVDGLRPLVDALRAG